MRDLSPYRPPKSRGDSWADAVLAGVAFALFVGALVLASAVLQ